jgi:hypothetical protein
MFAVGLVMLHEHPFLVGVLSEIPDTASKDQMSQIRQDQQAMIAQIRILLEDGTASAAGVLAKKEPDFVVPKSRKNSDCMEQTKFFSGALTERVILLNNGSTVMRREPMEIPNGCVVVSDRPLNRTLHGLFFSVRLEGVLQGGWNNSWPMLGMTQTSPEEMMATGYPLRGEWCGKSICIGGEFQAWSREAVKHKYFGKSKGPGVDLHHWDGPRPRWQGRTNTPWNLEEGDVMGMLYEPSGMVHLMINYRTVLSIDTGKPMPEGLHYALVDCQGQAYELTMLPHELPFVGCIHELSLQPLISHKVVDFAARAAASRAVSNCTFSVSIADPSQPDVPLVAISPAFEKMTGYKCEEVVGKNCRFLNHDCGTSFEMRHKLRRSCQTGRPYTGVLQNRGKSGDLFWNLLDLCGLTVAKDVVTGEDIWYLVGIQSNVSSLVDQEGKLKEEIQEKHHKELQAVAEHLRKELQAEFAALAVASQPKLVQGIDSEDEEGEAPQQFVRLPAPEGIQIGPKPDQHPMITVLPEPFWMTHVEDDPNDSDTLQVKTEANTPTNITSHTLAVMESTSSALSCLLRQGRPHLHTIAAFTVGVASVVLLQIYFRRQHKTIGICRAT